MHSCCGPCTIHPAKALRDEGLEVTSYWYNPNVQPFTEHQKRLESMRELAGRMGIELLVQEGYEMIAYLRAVVGHEGQRCRDCYRMRLERTAQTAGERGFDFFTTTLLISPYQDHELIAQFGNELAESCGTQFYFRDFTDGFRESQQTAKELGLYRQKYCGCVYSEWERYAKMKID